LRRAQNLHDLGRDHDAKALFERVSSFARSPRTTPRPPSASRHLEDDPAATRRRLAAILVRHPNDADVRSAWRGRAVRRFDRGGPHAHRPALKLEPDNPTYLAELGGIEFRDGRPGRRDPLPEEGARTTPPDDLDNSR